MVVDVKVTLRCGKYQLILLDFKSSSRSVVEKLLEKALSDALPRLLNKIEDMSEKTFGGFDGSLTVDVKVLGVEG